MHVNAHASSTCGDTHIRVSKQLTRPPACLDTKTKLFVLNRIFFVSSSVCWCIVIVVVVVVVFVVVIVVAAVVVVASVLTVPSVGVKCCEGPSK